MLEASEEEVGAKQDGVVSWNECHARGQESGELTNERPVRTVLSRWTKVLLKDPGRALPTNGPEVLTA